jgi:sugar-specific transcriptional regulator TrmB
VVKEVSDEMIAWKTKGTELYQHLPEQLRNTLRRCEPLRQETEQKPLFTSDYKPFKK